MRNRSLFAAASLAALAVSSPAFAIGPMSANERRAGRYLRDGGGHPTPSPAPAPLDAAAIIAEIKRDLGSTTDKVKEIAEKALAEAERRVPMGVTFKGDADELLLKMNTLTERLAELEQAGVNKPDNGEAKGLGDRFIETDSYKALINSPGMRGKADLSLKATITSATTNAAGSAGAGVNETRLPGILPLGQRRTFIQDLITPGQMSGSSLEYVRQTGFTNGAGMVAEGAAKPASDIKLELVTTGAKVIAHYMKASRQILDDAPQLRSLIDNNLLYGLAFKKEAQILSGDGTGQNLLGIIPQATPFALPAGAVAAGANLMDVLRFAMLQAVLAEYPATGHVLHPVDWANIETSKDANGRYIIGNPQGSTGPALWGLPVVATQFITQGKFLTGAFALGAQYFDRWAARVELATENEDDFIKNLVTLLAEERGALAVYRPEAFIYGNLVVPIV